MPERLRQLLDRPLEPATARAVLALAAAVLLGYSAVIAISGFETDGGPGASIRSYRQPAPRLAPAPIHALSRQDPQDDPASAAAHRSRRELHRHAALQHVPYRQGGVSVALVGARGGRAVLRVSAPTRRLARAGWHHFLRRFSDTGSSYTPTFPAPGKKGPR